LIIKLAGEFRTKPKRNKNRILQMPPVADGIPWGFFDGAIQGYPPLCGIGALLYISKTHHFTIIYVLGRGSSDKAKLATLWALLFHVDMMKLHKLQVFEDSQIVVHWINGKTFFQVRRLWPIMVYLQELIEKLE
jgi:ribonuclease HI